MLIILGGLPATGKTTIAKALATRLKATYLRVDSIEQAIFAADGNSVTEIGAEGYFVAYAVAADNLQLGQTVIADSVNSLEITRQAWKNVAAQAHVKTIEIEIICSDKGVHRKRVEARLADIKNHSLPNWNDVLNRDYETWDSIDLVIDTALYSVQKSVELILQNIEMKNQSRCK
ncbi:AAA family ATPase [Acinetobacter sp. ANC 4648]|uniref:AAA family ATPase n=1 Tax=Acinetobacter sp. ANC 4648 TaxID=1977875 RepID=UPI000A3558C9|nr:AAA family ATPase [Acinetobacter sp. ANC 4648]OTG83660.1 adenylyl-sulfate kinase [Acinetobacter sp. ANC 4648]